MAPACTSKLVQKCFEPKFSSARTKAEAIVCDILAPYGYEELECDLECANFVSIFTDSSNHNSIKMFPVLVRYFKPSSSVHIKILEMTNLAGETAVTISTYLASKVYISTI